MITNKIRLNSADTKVLAELLEIYETTFDYEIYVNAYIIKDLKVYEVYKINVRGYDTCLYRGYNFNNLCDWFRKKLKKKWYK